MRRLIGRGVLVALAALAGTLAPAWAQNREKAWEINPNAGNLFFQKTKGEKVLKDTWDIGFRFGYNWTKHHQIEFGFYGASTTNGEGLSINSDLLGGQINYDYNIFLQHRDRIVGFLTGGVGALNISSFGFVTNSDLVGDKLEFTYNVGAGIRFFGGERSGFRLDVRRTSFNDTGVNVNFYEASVGLTVVLGGAY